MLFLRIGKNIIKIEPSWELNTKIYRWESIHGLSFERTTKMKRVRSKAWWLQSILFGKPLRAKITDVSAKAPEKTCEHIT